MAALSFALVPPSFRRFRFFFPPLSALVFGLSPFRGGDRWCTGFWSLSSIFVNFVLYFFSNLSPGLLIGVRSPLVSSFCLLLVGRVIGFLVLYLPPKLSLCLSPCCWFGWADVGEFGSYVHPNCLSLYYHLRIVALLLSSLNVMFWHRRWIQCTWKVKEENRRSSVGESDFTVEME